MVALRRTRRGYEEVAPKRCASCEAAFEPGRVTVGIQHCACENNMHRSWRCPCGQTTLMPPAGEHCRSTSLDGR